ncbi:ribonuclease P protein component [Clostridium sp. D2Q-14]|uniref:ribonuclease P protein component n=1 Tax=Anaeromonas gelatinilytica TaxID=2683194 RepID=UPI00193C2806|nr:ribonuclease P protein component [Anaeromonas gelatinilytica]MBS4534948.1 ribonuclease P protein component [Anaeromonas gelatinilytica]
MNKILKLRNNRDFSKVYDKGKSIANKYLVMFYIENELDYNRVGFSTTKKLGNAVIRNRVKRLIKESYRLNNDKLINGYDIIFLARVRANNASYKEIEKSIINLLKRSKLNK